MGGGGNMKVIERNDYLKALIARRENGQVKVVTGIRRCGKSYLLKVLFKDWLVKEGNVQPDDILAIELDDSTWLRCRNPLELEKTVKEWKAARGEGSPRSASRSSTRSSFAKRSRTHIFRKGREICILQIS